ncbi:uncharacterized protein LOC123544898 [Mercenaria mercenaria]|uniref:uncharacterized protein LOC123544898 n=1 Tax=Mercenaria mercenaria TaxID=6596 RepID=UPI00234EA6A3|nr:uncharacterized protein LOC123544898 [Mercenaria mercenaria]
METVEQGIQYFQDHTQRVFEHIEKQALRVGAKCDKYMDNDSPRKKYLCEVLLRVPLFFIIHQWLLFSPYSYYWIIELFLFVVRYGVAFLLVGTWALNIGVLLQVYTILTFDLAISWLTRINYWTHQDGVHGLCHEKNVLVWTDVTEQWRVPALCSSLLQFVYLCYRPGAFVHREKKHVTIWIYVALLATLVPNILSVSNIFPSLMSELSYWIEIILFIIVFVLEVVSNMDVDAKVDEKKLMLLTAKHTLANDEQTKLEYRTRIQDLRRRIEKRNQGSNFVERFPVALLLVGTWTFNNGVLLQLYTSLTFDIAIMWLKRMDYWTREEEASRISQGKMPDFTERWRTPAVYSILLQIVYICYRPGAFIHKQKKHVTAWIYIPLLVTLVPNILSALSIFTSGMSELSYWIESTLLTAVFVSEILSNADVDLRVDKKKLRTLTTDEHTKLKYNNRIQDLQRRIDKRSQSGSYADRFPDTWFIRDTMLAFGAFYFFLTLLIEITIYQRQIGFMLTLDTFLEVSTIWCTTNVVVIFISYGLGFISNLNIALCHMFLTTEINIIEAIDANSGGFVQVSALIAFTEANILSLEYTEKSEAITMVVFLAVYAIIFQTLDVLQEKILNAVYSGISPGVLFYLRVGILSGLLVTAPTFSTFIVSKHLDINPWLFFLASGNCTLILRAIFMLVECVLVCLTWYTARHLSKLEGAIHYTRLSKGLCIVILNTAQSYGRYICPFFKGWWFVRLCLAIFRSGLVCFTLGRNEVTRFKNRNKMVTLLNKLPDETFQSHLTSDNGEEESNECAICYNVMTEGKTLPCKHTFHKDCLRRWFQVRVVCPFLHTRRGFPVFLPV